MIKWKKADKINIVDTENKKYIDFTSGIFTSSIGYNNDYLKKAVKQAVDKGFNHTYHYYNNYRELYVSKLIKLLILRNLRNVF